MTAGLSLAGPVVPACVAQEDSSMADWVKREHTKGEIDRAGKALVPWWKATGFDQDGLTSLQVGQYYAIIQNWRASHAMPLLTCRMLLNSRARKVEKGALIAQRMKRFASVMDKLSREQKMPLSQMQDLGGCRAILSSVDAVYELFRRYGRGPMLFDDIGSLRAVDYIAAPKNDGYRGIHIISRYRPTKAHLLPWQGQRIEIQLRSKLQHAFSTAVETVTTFTRHPLKFGGGPKNWRRFFALMGSAMAIREGTEPVPETPSERVKLVRELRELARELRVRQRLKAWADALTAVPKTNTRNFLWLLLVLDIKAERLTVTGFQDKTKADELLAQLERDKNIDAVLVWVPSAADLKAAYPNYYADTGQFIAALDAALRSGV